MKTDIYLCTYLVKFFLEWEMFLTKVVCKIKTYILSYSLGSFFYKNMVVIYVFLLEEAMYSYF